jgi:prevent-host-death family protein
MSSESVAARELRQHLSEYLDEARAGAQFLVTRNGRSVAVLGPVEVEERSVAVEVEDR